MGDLQKDRKMELLELSAMKKLHGGYWRYNFLDFHYLYNDYFPTSEMLDVIKDNLSDLIEFYPSTQSVIARILEKWKDDSWFNEDNLIVGNGSSELILTLNRKISNVAVPLPTFNEYTKFEDENVRYFHTSEEASFRLDIDELILFIKKYNCKSVVLNNPNNPTGHIIRKKDIIKILNLGILVIIDEAFIDWSAAQESCENLICQYTNLIIIKSLTKITGAGGLRIGYLLTTNSEMKNFVRSNLPIWNINSISERFLELLVNNKKQFNASIERIVINRDALYEELNSIKNISPYSPNANFIFCKTGINAKTIEDILFAKYKIMIKAGISQKGLESNNFFRVAVRGALENKVLVEALKEIVSLQ